MLRFAFFVLEAIGEGAVIGLAMFAIVLVMGLAMGTIHAYPVLTHSVNR